VSHDPALEAHEHAEHAEHAAHAGDPFISSVAISVAVLAVLAAVAGSLETVEGGKALSTTSEAALAQDKATDTWAEYEADSIKRNMFIIAGRTPGTASGDDAKNIKKYGDRQQALQTKAKDLESERERLLGESGAHEARHHWLTGSATLFEIGIAMSTVAIITHRRWLWGTAVTFGVVGLGLLARAYLA
jgi:hypothetical protein